ncbi:MAG: hypothetical protein FWD40_02980 [Treponema sp.]|nr:hypothetical protein [Treponema sp.]
MNLLLLLIYSCFTINLVLQCGLGISGIAESKRTVDLQSVTQLIIVFLSVILLWAFFSRLLHSLISGIYIYVLLFPVSAIVYSALEFTVFRYVLKKDASDESFVSFHSGITAAAVFICINISNNILEVIILSFGFASGIFLVNMVIREIRRRAALEAVPLFLRGKPLILIAMGLFSLILTTASLLLFRMIGAG